MKTELIVENIKCNGCTNTIKKAVSSHTGIEGIDIEITTGKIILDHIHTVDIEDIKSKLFQLGYPEKGSLTGMHKVAKQAQSFVSCAVGKMDL